MNNVLKYKQKRVSMRQFMEDNVPEDVFLNVPFEKTTPTKQNSVCKLIARRMDVKYDQARRIYSLDACSPCLTATASPLIMTDDDKVRSLTAREGYRFMGVKDEDIDKLLTTSLSTKQHLSLAGNSICVPVMQVIFEQFLEEYVVNKQENKVLKLEE
jgi:site-specific DNA-cytosine methylase